MFSGAGQSQDVPIFHATTVDAVVACFSEEGLRPKGFRDAL